MNVLSSHITLKSPALDQVSRLKRYEEDDDKPTTAASTDKENMQPN